MAEIIVSGGTPAIATGIAPPLAPPIIFPGFPILPAVPFIKLNPTQVVGLIPLFPCDSKECRELCFDGIIPCFKNPVFGELIGQSYQTGMTYENDWNTFLVDISLYNANPSLVTVTFELEKFFDGEWRGAPFGVNLNSNIYGQFFPIGSILGHPTYTGYAINWASILYHVGHGCYRFKVRTNFSTFIITSISGGTQATCTFTLQEHDCHLGAINGILQTTSGSPPAYYSFNQLNNTFTIAQNVQFIVNFINAQTLPYTATYLGGNSFTITGQNFAYNNNVSWLLTTWKTSFSTYCTKQYTQKMQSGINPVSTSSTTIYKGCLVSPPFDLKKWDCNRAHGTVKFETWLTGIIGDPYLDYKIHDLCKILWYDSLRTHGFIGYQKSPEYLTKNLEWGAPIHGKIEKISDEQIQRWEYFSNYLPEYIHTRFSTFAMMSDTLFGSDYNINNSDYTIKRKNVIYDSGYEPEYIDNQARWDKRNKAKVKVFFKRGVQSVIKSLCCIIK
jgi:hypothetical protein